MKKILCFIMFTMILSIQLVGASSNRVYLGGETISIQGLYDGVIVSGMYEFNQENKCINPAISSQIDIGDKIVMIEKTPVISLDTLYDFISSRPKINASYEITVKNENELEKKQLDVYYLENEQLFKTGLYVKDQINGIGTVTFYNPENKSYASLGHEIIDNDLKVMANIVDGNSYLANVLSVKKSEPNIPGEKNSSTTNIKIGNVVKNTNFGLYGKYEYLSANKQLIEIGQKEFIELGYATMYTVLDRQRIEEVLINITTINKQSVPDIKGFQFEIIDKKCIDKTGGIVQGMSGSPIVQNDKLIGAVTHMITSSPTKGYGIFIENMLEMSKRID